MNHTTFARRHKRDATHGEVACTLVDFGWVVEDLSVVGHGITDLLIGRDRITDLVEVKSGPGATYTPAQLAFRARWRGSPPVRLENQQQAIDWATRTIRERQHRQQEVRHEPRRSDHD